jgi:hypothetical protein
MSKVLAGLELHLPFHHKDSLDFLETVADTFKIDKVVCVGDLFDVHANSRHDHDPDGMSAGSELDQSAIAAEDVFELFPEAKYCIGNHCGRIAKAAYKAGIPARAIKSIPELYGLPDEWEVAEYHEIDGVIYEHGDRFGSGDRIHINAATKNMKSTVVGHAHTTFGVEYFANRDKLIFGACAGGMIDPHSYAASYAKAMAKKSILGAMVIIDGSICIPVPMILDHQGNWIRRVG